ncbi:MAG: NADH-quinone oxidoreductase subunit L [Myxococcales bacterium]|nr:NADH-quinone oxidoreductase subunit L [Myxococcales bacterium]
MSHQTLALFVLLSPLVAAVVLFIVAPLRVRGPVSAGITIASTAISLGASVMLAMARMFGQSAPNVDIQAAWLPGGGKVLSTVGVYVDPVAAPMMVVVALVALCVQVYSLGYLGHEPSRDRGRYFAYHALFAFSMLGLVMAPNLLQLFLCWELVGLASYLLIGYYWTKPSAGQAALKAFWVTKFADMGLMLGLMVLFVKTGGFDWTVPPGQVLMTADAEVIAGLLFLAVVGKSAQFPMHIWLPDAMEGPTPVSALLHAATMVAAGVYLIVRAYPIFSLAPTVLTFMVYLGAFTALFAAIVAVFQDDIKKVLAFSTCSQLGYMVAALGTGSMVSGYFHLTTHAFFKALLFLTAGSLIHAVHSNSLHDMGGLWKKMKPTGVLLIIGSLALAGFPMTSGFFSKDLILEELLHAGHIVPLIAAIAAAGLTAFYMTRVVMLSLFGAPSEAAEHAHESPAVMLAPMALLGALALVGGLLHGDFAKMAGAEAAFHITPVGIIATATGLTGIAAGLWRFSPGKRAAVGSQWVSAPMRFVTWLTGNAPVDRAFALFYRRVMLTAAAGVAWFDRYIIDALINLSGWAVLKGAERFRRLQTGRPADYIYAVIAGLIALTAMGVM